MCLNLLFVAYSNASNKTLIIRSLPKRKTAFPNSWHKHVSATKHIYMFEIDGIITMSYSQYSVFPRFKCYLLIQHNTFFNCDHVLFLRGCCNFFPHKNVCNWKANGIVWNKFSALPDVSRWLTLRNVLFRRLWHCSEPFVKSFWMPFQISGPSFSEEMQLLKTEKFQRGFWKQVR